MAGSRSRTRQQQRHSTASRQSRERQWITIGTVAVLGLVAVIVVVGLVVAWYLPPRAHVLTVGSRDFNARQVADRAHYLALTGNGNAAQQPATEGVDSLVRQEILLQVGATMVDEVTEQDVGDAIAQRLGLTGEYTDEAYASSLQSFLRAAPIDREPLEDIIRAGIIEDRLVEQFEAELPEAGDQMKVWRVRTGDRAAAQALADAVRGGAEFSPAALEAGAAESEEDVTDLGWFAPEALAERIRPTVEALQGGEVADPIEDANRLGFEVYYVETRTVDQPYEDTVRGQLADRALLDFFDAQEAALEVEVGLSSGERQWITKRVQDALIGG